jgi:hypothetical protein
MVRIWTPERVNSNISKFCVLSGIVVVRLLKVERKMAREQRTTEGNEPYQPQT